MIDPLETLIVYLKADPQLVALTGGRIAGKHRYGVSWTVGLAALVVRADGGTPDNYVPTQTLRVECNAYAEDQPTAMGIWRRLVEISRATERKVVATTEGNALLSSFLQESAPSLLFDPTVGMDMALCFFRITVGESAV